MDPAKHRQQVLFLWSEDSSLEGRVIAWSFHDGSNRSADQADRPYRSCADALVDGWRLIQVSQLIPAVPGAEHTPSFLKHEFIFEKIVSVDHHDVG